MHKSLYIRYIFLAVGLNAGEIMANNSLKTYRSKRNLKKSGEPQGKKKQSHKKPIFVIQQHAASHMHYDFRIEIDGVLKSWAVPKGPSLNPSIKRLAVLTEDHPMDYASFEGIIPKGNYGAGSVIVWDTGTYENIKEIDGKLIPMEDCFEKGTIEINIHGEKLHGSYALIRTHLSEKEPWLLIKMNDDHADKRRNIIASNPKSVLSGKTIQEMQTPEDTTIKIDKYAVNITHPDKIIASHPTILKKELIDYYQKIAPIMLPYIKDRPLTMHRFVDGFDKPGFYQKEAGEYFPDYIKRVTIKKEGGVVHHAVVKNSAGIVYLANQLSVFHIWLSTIKHVNKPDRIIFDLDPSGKDFSLVRATALQLKKILEYLGLTPFVMTTGSRGLHVVIPIKPEQTFDTVHKFAHEIAQLMVDQNPETLTLEMRKEKRGTKIFVDYLRNGFGATGIAPYSVRAKAGAPIATPLEWSEVSKKTLKPDEWNINNIFKRLEIHGDPWKDMHKQAKGLKQAQKKLNTLIKESKK